MRLSQLFLSKENLVQQKGEFLSNPYEDVFFSTMLAPKIALKGDQRESLIHVSFMVLLACCLVTSR